MRALLTDNEREALRKGKDHPEISENYIYKIHYNVRQRLDSLDEDLDVLFDEYPEGASQIVDLVDQYDDEEVEDAASKLDDEDDSGTPSGTPASSGHTHA